MQEGTGSSWRWPNSQQNVEQQPCLEPESVQSQQQNLTESTRAPGGSARPTKERPCDACRRRKTRCVKEQGEEKCVLCKFHTQECTYLHEPIARNRKRKAQSKDDAGRKSQGNTGPLRTNVGTGIEEYNQYPGESLLKQTLGLQNKHHANFVGLTEPFSFPRFTLPLGTSQKSTQGGPVTVRKVDSFNAFIIRKDCETLGYGTELSRLDSIQQLVEPYGQALVDLYFRIVHPSFPILHEGVFLEKYARSYREFSPSLLAAVYLLSTNYWSYSTALADKPRPDASSLWFLAIESFDMTIYRPKLSSVQAGLLLAQYETTDINVVDCGSRGRLTAHLVSLAQTLGLHMDPSCWDIPQWEISLRCRLAWALFMQDKWVALIEGRPPLLSSNNWVVPGVQLEDFPDSQEHDEEGSSEVERGRVVFMQMIELTRILSDTLDTVFSLRAHQDIQASSDPLRALIDRVRPLQLRLKHWSSFALDVLCIGKTTAMKLTAVGYLKLAYLAVEVSIHRRIMCQTMSTAGDPHLVALCRTAAKQRWLCALDFVEELKAQHIKSFWYFCSAACLSLLISFGNLLVASSPDHTQAAFYFNKLKEFRWTLKINGEMGAKFMKAALKSMILDPKEISKPELAGMDAILTPASGTECTFGQTPLVSIPLQSVPNPMSIGPSHLATHWVPNPSVANPPAFTDYIPYLPGYNWQQSTFGAEQAGNYLGDA